MRLIDVEHFYCADCEWKDNCENVKRDVKDMPVVDAVPVVYCKDCKYADTERRNATEKRYYNAILICRNSNLCNDEPLAMWPTDFCSYGERKDGGADSEID